MGKDTAREATYADGMGKVLIKTPPPLTRKQMVLLILLESSASGIQFQFNSTPTLIVN